MIWKFRRICPIDDDSAILSEATELPAAQSHRNRSEFSKKPDSKKNRDRDGGLWTLERFGIGLAGLGLGWAGLGRAGRGPTVDWAHPAGSPLEDSVGPRAPANVPLMAAPGPAPNGGSTDDDVGHGHESSAAPGPPSQVPNATGQATGPFRDCQVQAPMRASRPSTACAPGPPSGCR
jgi:hypothetical protein